MIRWKKWPRDFIALFDSARADIPFARDDANRLLPPSAATTIRVRNGRTLITDGPWVETKEQLGGYYVLEAKDLDEAVQLASKIPGAWIGCVELRPIAEDPQTMEALGRAGDSPGV